MSASLLVIVLLLAIPITSSAPTTDSAPLSDSALLTDSSSDNTTVSNGTLADAMSLTVFETYLIPVTVVDTTTKTPKLDVEEELKPYRNTVVKKVDLKKMSCDQRLLRTIIEVCGGECRANRENHMNAVGCKVHTLSDAEIRRICCPAIEEPSMKNESSIPMVTINDIDR